ncbi:MAG: hypothetical protein SFY69_09245 [Planctomycetota bacterium]|nr:hypothetical protein [Planctomycetota bacterium]
MLLAMLRAKNVPEIIFWTPGDVVWQTYSWRGTVELTRYVYAASIDSVTTAFGHEPQDYPGHDPLMLEYTLRTPAGEQSTAMVVPQWYSLVTSQGTMFWQQAGIEVGVRLQMLTGAEMSTYVDFRSQHSFEVHVEDQGNPEIIGQVLALNVLTNEWHALSLRESGTQYGFITPDAESRRTFVVPQSSTGVQFVESDPSEPDVYRMTVRLIHRGVLSDEAPPWTVSRFNLLQVVPILQEGSPDPGEGLSSADIDGDGEVTGLDLQMFSQDLAELRPGADLDRDGVVSGDDVTSFLEAYAGTP